MGQRLIREFDPPEPDERLPHHGLIRAWLMAGGYDFFMRRVEALGLAQWRRDLLARVSGEVLEIGAGTGGNLPHYPQTLGSLVLTEPSRPMRQRLVQRLAACGRPGVRIADSPDRVSSSQVEGWDAVVTTLVLCSVPDLAACLADIHGRLRPGGRLFFIEHVLAEDLPGVMLWQQRLQPVWSWCCGNCHLTRRTEEAIAAAGFEFETLCRDRLRGVPAVAQTVIRGIARKPC